MRKVWIEAAQGDKSEEIPKAEAIAIIEQAGDKMQRSDAALGRLDCNP